MDGFTACGLIEGYVDPESEDTALDEIIEACQYLVDTGLVWQLQGFYGRQATELIAAGLVTDERG